jgi:hypothetical protein
MIRPWLLATMLVSAIPTAETADNPPAATAAAPVAFDARTAQSGPWSDAATWEGGRKPAAGHFVQVRAGHVVTYDVQSQAEIRMIHIAGTLTFSREKSTLLDVGLIRVEPGDTTTENGFDCLTAAPAHHGGGAVPVLEIGTPSAPIPAGVSAVIRLRHFPGTDKQVLPAIVVCGGRWDVHGAPLARTWTRLAAPAKSGDLRITLEESVGDWRPGDRILVTTGGAQGPETGHTFQKRPFARQKIVGTEERTILEVAGTELKLDRPLVQPHRSEGMMRSEVAVLSRNTVIESAEPAGVRGHTMYHHGSSGAISYAEFRHLGKEGVLGKYPIHFHLVRDTMRGSGVVGASIWDSHNRWITVHGTDHLLVRDCVGYQSRGHGYFLEDATEQWNVFDRNLAVQAFSSSPLPSQVLPFDPNDGAGFWWANGNNTFTRNAACENDHYGFHFQVLKSGNFNPLRRLRGDDGEVAERDVRSIPFLRFEDNETHGDGLFGFRFGDEEHGSVRGTPELPFVVRNLRVWDAHYAIRPNVSCFLLEGLRVRNSRFGIYRPDCDAHVYRDVEFHNVTAEPLNGGHDEESVPVGDFTYERLSFVNCRLQRDPLVQLTAVGSRPGLFGHFRDVRLVDSGSGVGQVVDFGGGPRTRRTEPQVAYYFHDSPTAGAVVRVSNAALPRSESSAGGTPVRRKLSGWTGEEARVETVAGVTFPQLLAPVDKAPPATLITRVSTAGGKRTVSGVAHDNGLIRTVTVNGRIARIVTQHAGVADWTVKLDAPADERILAESTDEAGNVERMPHVIGRPAHAHHH